MILSKVKQFFAKNKKIFFYIALFLAVYYFFSETSFAAEKTEQQWVNTINTVLNETLWWLSILVWAMTYFITLFLDPGWINGSIFKLNIAFKSIWIMVSNVVYFIFAWILIWIAFMNIIWKWDKWELKKSLPKFIVWVLIVPFSWFFVQLVLSVSWYLTVSILTLPSEIFTSYDTKLTEIKIPKECIIDFNYSSSWTTLSDISMVWNQAQDGKFFYCSNDEDNKITLKEAMDKSSFWLISMYTYWILNIQNLKTIFTQQINDKTIVKLSNVIIKLVFNVLFVLVYMILFVSLWLVLLSRWIYLWLFTIFSPVFWLMYFFDKKEWWWEWLMKKFSIKEFISLAFVPVYVMFALSFWLFFINTITTSINVVDNNPTTTKPNISISNNSNIKNANDNDIKGDTINILGIFKLNVKSPLDSATNDGKWSPLNFFTLTKDWSQVVLWTIWTLILYMLWIWVLRVSIMAALRSSEITREIVQPIYEFWNDVWKIIQSWPKNMPVFWTLSASWLQNISWTAVSTIDEKWRKSWKDFMEKHGLFWQWVDFTSKADSALKAMQNTSLWADKRFEKLKEWILAWNNVAQITSNKDLTDAIKIFAEEIGIKGAKDLDLTNKQTMANTLWQIEHKLENDSSLKSKYKWEIFWTSLLSNPNNTNSSDIDRILSNNKKDGSSDVAWGWGGTTSKVVLEIKGVNSLNINDEFNDVVWRLETQLSWHKWELTVDEFNKRIKEIIPPVTDKDWKVIPLDDKRVTEIRKAVVDKLWWREDSVFKKPEPEPAAK